ncbi:carboxypeptidase-like regulatory domain-containing protein [Chitinophagaceae bacterium MMS25-I14]
MKVIPVVALLVFLSSCDCLRQFSGTVTDKITHQPVANARVSVERHREAVTTDSAGNFKLRIMDSGPRCFCKLKERIIVKHPDYNSQVISIYQAKIELERADTLRK